jgi:hypothetical protein
LKQIQNVNEKENGFTGESQEATIHITVICSASGDLYGSHPVVFIAKQTTLIRS